MPALHTSFSSSRTSSEEIHDTLPFILTEQNNILVDAILNGQDTLRLMFDAGDSHLSLTLDAIEHRTHLFAKGDSIDWNKMPNRNSLQMGQLRWEKLPTHPTRLSGQGSDGRFGRALFQNNAVEINYDRKEFIVHSNLPSSKSKMVKLPFVMDGGHPGIHASIKIGGTTFRLFFNYDNGYQRAVFLDNTVLNQDELIARQKRVKTTKLRDGAGNEIITEVILSESIKIGTLLLENVPTQLLGTRQNPAGRPTHFFGNELLKRFNTILDLKHFQIYFAPSENFDLPYIDAS